MESSQRHAARAEQRKRRIATITLWRGAWHVLEAVQVFPGHAEFQCTGASLDADVEHCLPMHVLRLQVRTDRCGAEHQQHDYRNAFPHGVRPSIDIRAGRYGESFSTRIWYDTAPYGLETVVTSSVPSIHTGSHVLTRDRARSRPKII